MTAASHCVLKSCGWHCKKGYCVISQAIVLFILFIYYLHKHIVGKAPWLHSDRLFTRNNIVSVEWKVIDCKNLPKIVVVVFIL